MKKSVKVCLFISSMFVSFGLSGQEIYQSNAASASNETGTTSGWSHSSSATLSVDNIEKHVGSSSIKVTSTSSGWAIATYQFTAEIGKTYDITIWAKKNSTSISPGFFQWTGFSNFQTQGITSTSWTKYDFSLTASATTANIKVYTAGSWADQATGQAVYIDGITITEQGSGGDTQAPTAPTALSSTGQTQTTIDLDWTAATDDVGVTGYKVFRNSSLIATLGAVTSYTATGLTAGTQYSFHVTALDAANNESVASSSISATTDTASGGGSGGLWTESGSDIHYTTGNVGIGTASPNGWKLAVNGHIRAKEIKVETDWADYVFKDNYKLPTLEEVEKHIKENGHLINIPSAMEVEANGIQLGEMNKLLLEKIEELTLYTLEQEKKIKQQGEELKILKKLEKRLEIIENKK